MADPKTLHDLIVRVLDEGFAKDQAEEALIRDEIKRCGTFWAGHEIWQLRRQVAALQGRLAKREQKES